MISQEILQIDALVARLRAGTTAARLQELQLWQAQRLAQTYADLREDPRHASAVEFFLRDLYGPHELRDREFERAWHSLGRALPTPLLTALREAIELQVLTMELDLKVANALPPGLISPTTYRAAYRAVGQREDRDRQIALVIAIGESLDRAVHRPWVRLTLLTARLPAIAAGLGTLQDFLERGLDAFREMRDARRLLGLIRERETLLLQVLFDGSEREAISLLQSGAEIRISPD